MVECRRVQKYPRGSPKNNLRPACRFHTTKLEFPQPQFEKLRELEVGYFTEHITLKVKVDKMKIKKVKLV